MRAAQALTPTPLARAHPRRQPRALARLSAHLRGPLIDRRLATGTVAWRSPAYAARAVQLTSRRSRVSLARSLESLVERADQPPTRLSAAVPPCREQVRHAAPLLLALASRLRSPEPVDVRGVAQLRELLSDGASPCFVRLYPEALTVALQEAALWLDVHG